MVKERSINKTNKKRKETERLQELGFDEVTQNLIHFEDLQLDY